MRAPRGATAAVDPRPARCARPRTAFAAGRAVRACWLGDEGGVGTGGGPAGAGRPCRMARCVPPPLPGPARLYPFLPHHSPAPSRVSPRPPSPRPPVARSVNACRRQPPPTRESAVSGTPRRRRRPPTRDPPAAAAAEVAAPPLRCRPLTPPTPFPRPCLRAAAAAVAAPPLDHCALPPPPPPQTRNMRRREVLSPPLGPAVGQ